jgi:WD40 repeat protein
MAFSGRNAGRHVYLWDLKAERMIDPPLDGPGGDWVFGLAFSPDGRLLAGGSGEILLWDVASHHLLGKPFHPLTTQSAVSFSPDSKKLAAWSGSSNVCLIDVDLASWMARAKAIANRELTAGERQFYLGGTP